MTARLFVFLLLSVTARAKLSPPSGTRSPLLPPPASSRRCPSTAILRQALSARGGGKSNAKDERRKDDKGMLSSAQEMYMNIPPSSRIHLSVILFTTVVHLLGLPAPVLFALDPSKIFPQVWRVVTACAYLGQPSMSMVNNLYFLYRFGLALETHEGSASHMWFLLVQMFSLSTLGLLLGFPFQAKALVAATVYAGSRINPNQQFNFQFGVPIKSWHLPFCLMAIDCLSGQSMAAAWPHIMGIMSSHLFYFFRDIWPEKASQDRSQIESRFLQAFQTPSLLKKWLKSPHSYDRPNDLDFRKKDSPNDKFASNKILKRQVLGSSSKQ